MESLCNGCLPPFPWWALRERILRDDTDLCVLCYHPCYRWRPGGPLCIRPLAWHLPPFLLFPAASRCFLALPCSYAATLSHLLLHELCLEGSFDAWTHPPKIRPGEESGTPDRANPQRRRGASQPAPRPAPLRLLAPLWDRGGAPWRMLGFGAVPGAAARSQGGPGWVSGPCSCPHPGLRPGNLVLACPLPAKVSARL